MNNTSTTPVPDIYGCLLSDQEIADSYHLGLHVASVFVLLFVSLLGACFSVLSTRVPSLHINPIIINTGKFFGIGVVLSTGFVHILPDAMSALTDPCLPDSWNVYGSYAGLFAMLACLGMQLIEFLAHQKLRSMQLKRNHLKAHIDVSMQHVHHEHEKPKEEKYVNDTNGDIKNTEQTNDETEEIEKVEQAIKANKKSGKNENDNLENMQENNNQTEEPGQMQQMTDRTGKPKEKKTAHRKHKNSEYMEEAYDETQVPEKKDHIDCVTVEILHMEPTPEAIDFCEGSAGHSHGAIFQDNGETNTITTYLLELGIALHSVLIGLTLGTTTDSFVALFIALCFHQFFEAIALGAQIANLKNFSMVAASGMVIFYALTTPVGIAIGIGVHAGIYNPKAVSTLLVTGILDSLAAGVLIYVSLVNLISAEMGANAHGFYLLRNRLKLLYYTALYLGVTAMAIIGRWA